MRAIDPFDNVDLTPAVHTWTVVAAPPGPTTSRPTRRSAQRRPTQHEHRRPRSASAGSDNATPGPYLTFECSLDGGAFAACTSPEELTGLAPRRAHLRGARHRRSPATSTPPRQPTRGRSRRRRPTRPRPRRPIDGPDPHDRRARRRRSPSRATRTSATFECPLDGAAFAACTSPHDRHRSRVGEHTFAVRAVDAAGNVDADPATRRLDGRRRHRCRPPLTCGQVVTQSILLTNDLLDCGGDGLVVGATASPSTSTVTSSTAPASASASGSTGSTRSPSRNGIVQEFDAGVALGIGHPRAASSPAWSCGSTSSPASS